LNDLLLFIKLRLGKLIMYLLLFIIEIKRPFPAGRLDFSLSVCPTAVGDACVEPVHWRLVCAVKQELI